MSKESEQRSTQKTFQEPTFNAPGAASLRDALTGAFGGFLDDQQTAQAQPSFDFFSKILQGQRPEFNLSQPVQDQIETIRQQAEENLPDQLAQARSEFARAPQGRSNFAIDDTVVQNNLARDNAINQLLIDQFNRDIATQLDAASSFGNLAAQNRNQSLQLLDLLSGQRGRQESRSVSEQPLGIGQIGAGLAGIGAGIGAIPTLGGGAATASGGLAGALGAGGTASSRVAALTTPNPGSFGF